MKVRTYLAIFGDLALWEPLKVTLKIISASKRRARNSVHSPFKKRQSDHRSSIEVATSIVCAVHGRFRPLFWHAIPQQPNGYASNQSTRHEMQSLLSGRHYRCIPVALVKSKSQRLFSKALMKPQKQIRTLWSSKDSVYELPSWVEWNVDCWS